VPLIAGREVPQIIERAVFHPLRDNQRLRFGEPAVFRCVLELRAFPKFLALPEQAEDQKPAFLYAF
jgi:hypothetical protein